MAIREDLLITFGAEILHIKQSGILFKENDAPEYYFQIIKGKVKLVNFNNGNGEFIQSIHEEGDSFGEIFLFCKHHRYPVSAVAAKDSVVLKLEQPRLLQLLESDFEIQLNFLKSCAERTYYSYVFLNSLTSEDATHQLLTVLDHLKESHATPETETQRYKIPYTRKELSHLTGLRIETVIRILRKLEREKIVEIIKGRVYY